MRKLLVLLIITFNFQTYGKEGCGLVKKSKYGVPYFQDDSGRRIYLDFGRHVYPLEKTKISGILESKDSPESKRHQIFGILKRRFRPKLEKEVRGSARRLESLIKEKKIQWAAIETSPEELGKRQGNERKYIRRVSGLIKEMGLTTAQTERLKLHQLGKLKYISARNPGKIALMPGEPGIGVVGVDDKKLRDISFDALYDVYDAQDFLRKRNFSHMSEVLAAREIILRDSSKTLPRDHYRKVIALGQAGVEQRMIKTILDGAAKITELARARDQTVSRRTLAQKGDGLLIFGDGHAPGIIRGMIGSCRNQQLIPASGSPAQQ